MTESNSVIQLTENDAFTAGSDLWVIAAEQSKWWQAIDFKSGFLLSSSLLFQKQNNTEKISDILQKTEIQAYDFKANTANLLLGSEGHFFNKWILILNNDLDTCTDEIETTCKDLNIKTVRFFAFNKQTLIKTTTRLKASLKQISFVE